MEGTEPPGSPALSTDILARLLPMRGSVELSRAQCPYGRSVRFSPERSCGPWRSLKSDTDASRFLNSHATTCVFAHRSVVQLQCPLCAVRALFSGTPRNSKQQDWVSTVQEARV